MVQVSGRQSWIAAEGHTNHLVDAPRVIRLSATKLSLSLVLPLKPVSIVVGTLPHEDQRP